MKNIIIIFLFTTLMFSISGCDKDFEQVNTNPVLATSLDAGYLFSNAEFNTAIQTTNYQSQIVQQIITPYTGVLEGGNHNIVYDPNSNTLFNSYYVNNGSGPIVLLTAVLDQTKDNANRSNLYNMARIWRAFVFQILTDTYGDVPYSEAGQAYLKSINLPKYDDQKVIYDDLLKEVSEATKALDASKPTEAGDLFYKGDISQWKKLGNSLLLRIAMRFTKVDANKAKQYAAIAADPANGGVMSVNKDNAYIAFNATFNNPSGNYFQGTERGNIYLGKPFVDYLKSTSDPRLAVISVKYETPSNPLGTTGAENTNPADQNGMPFGYNESTISTEPDFPGKTGSAFNYAQLNRRTLAKIDAPEFFMTAAQTQLLLAEAVNRGFITGDAGSYFSKAITLHMQQLATYDPLATVDPNAIAAYVAANPLNTATALQQINTQYWIASFLNGSEAWANFRRSGYPALVPNPYPNADPAVKGGFIHRLTYPVRELSVNSENYNAAVARMGADNMATRLFWDK